MATTLLWACTAFASGLLTVGGEPDAAVHLSAPSAEVDTQRRQLRLTMHAENTLPVAVEAVDVGVLFATRGEALAGVDASALYAGKLPPPGVEVLYQQVPVALVAHGQGTLVLTHILASHSDSPNTYVTHVLGYRLAQPRADVLLNLLQTDVAADERAACETLALGGSTAEKAHARQQFGADSALRQALEHIVGAPLQEKPSQRETFRRVYAATALGVLGGASAALTKALADPAVHAWDEPLQVLRLARLTATPFEAPLAFVMDVSARTYSQVLAAALEETQADVAADAHALHAPSGARADATPSQEASRDDEAIAPTNEPWVMGRRIIVAIATAIIVIIAYRLGYRWRRGR